MASRTIKEKYSPAAWVLYEYRITASEVAASRVPPKSRIGVSVELQGCSPLTEETLNAIFELSGGNVEMTEDVKRFARESFIEKNPARPERHAFHPKVVTA